ncbi:MAG: hypothetical protein QOG03_1575 [Actinomycetota bacterium]|jgi:hypothetical protein|nr:hypothetical protein [Actinomycetota bacterium]
MTNDELQGWFTGRVPDDWFTGLEVKSDRDEIVVVGTIAEPKLEAKDNEAAAQAARRSRADAFREETRERRIHIASEAEHRFGKKVTWGVKIGSDELRFTSLAAPVMTRLRFEERAVLDTLVDASVARSRSDALAWCVRLVAQHQGEWIDQLRDALVEVERVRTEGPAA